jgi:cytoskeleton protein RodZ
MNEARKSFGEELARLRREKGVGLEELARATKIRVSLLSALEAGRFESLPPPVFVVGYLQAVAMHLGADPEPLVQRFRRLADVRAPGAPGSGEEAPQDEKRPPRRRTKGAWIAGGLAAAALLAAGVFWALRWSPQVPVLDAPLVKPLPGPSGEAPAIEQETPSAESPSEHEGSPSVVPETRATPGPATPAETDAGPEGGNRAPEAAASVSAPGHGLVLEFSAPCWTEIWRGEERLVHREVKAGERLTFAGSSFRATFGDASSVRASFEGRPLALPSGPGRVVKDLAIPREAGHGGEAR